jgi:hypothetical protein
MALALVLAVTALGGCSIHRPDNDNGQSGDAVQITGDDSGKVAFNLPFAKGEVNVPQSMMRDGQVDIDGVKMIPGGKISGFNVNAGDKGSTVVMNFTSPVSPQDTRAYFLDQFKQKGVDAALAGDSITGTSRDGDKFDIEVGPGPTGSNGTINIRSNG